MNGERRDTLNVDINVDEEALIMDYQNALAKATKRHGRPAPKVKSIHAMTPARLLAVTYFAKRWHAAGRKL